MGLRSWLKKRVLKIDSPCAFSDVLSVNVVNLAPDLQTVERWRYPGMIQRVNEKELEECVEIIRRNLSGACLMSNRLEIWEFCFGKIPSVGAVLEFGVYKAESTNYFASILARRRDARILHGFDSFEGLSNDGHGWL